MGNMDLLPFQPSRLHSAAQISLLEDEMRRVERVNVALVLAGMGATSDVFRMVLSMLSLGAACASANVIYLLMDIGRTYSAPKFCSKYQLSVAMAMAFFSWFLIGYLSQFTSNCILNFKLEMPKGPLNVTRYGPANLYGTAKVGVFVLDNSCKVQPMKVSFNCYFSIGQIFPKILDGAIQCLSLKV